MLILHARDGDTDTVRKRLSTAGAQSLINYHDASVATSLFCAAHNGLAAVTEQQIEARCNIDLQDKDGVTTLCIAAHEGHASVTKQLIDVRCNIDLQDKFDVRISEKKEDTEKQIQGQSWYRKTKNVQFVELLFHRFLSLARVQFTHTHT